MERPFSLFPACLFAVLAVSSVRAQTIGTHHNGAKFAANKGDLQIGLAGSYLSPDYGPGSGFMLNPYAAFDFRRSYVGLEVDGNFTVHDKAGSHPNSGVLGLRLGEDLGIFRPYIKPGVGVGHFSGVTTAPGGKSQTYVVLEIGGGVDVQVREHINARAYGAYQFWPSFNGNTTASNNPGGALTPILAGGGIAYRF